MTKKTYKSAMGRIVDLGALILENENVRAVGNMHVNARGDSLDGTNRVIEPKNRQVQRQYKRQTTNVSDSQVISTSGSAAKKRREAQADITPPKKKEKEKPVEITIENEEKEELDEQDSAPRSGLAAAIARSQAVKQELLKTPKQLAKESGLKKI